MTYQQNKAWRYKNPKQRNLQKNKNYAKGSTGTRREWTAEENQMVLDRKMTDRELSFKIDRTIRAIQIHRCRLNGKGKS